MDVRRWPTSKTEHFKKEELKRWLNDAGVQYVWLGDSLGGYRKEAYSVYMNSKDFKESAKQLCTCANAPSPA